MQIYNGGFRLLQNSADGPRYLARLRGESLVPVTAFKPGAGEEEHQDVARLFSIRHAQNRRERAFFLPRLMPR